MSDLFKKRTIFDIIDSATINESEDSEVNGMKILKEAPEDDAGGDDAGGGDDTATDTGADDTGDNAADDGGDENTEDNNDDNADEDMGNDGDFDVDTSIDGDDGGDDTTDDTTGGDDLGGGGDMGSDEEVNPKNTNIFSTLTKEEQAIKIKELKKQYNDLYIYISDMLEKVNDISPDEDNLEAIYRITSALYDLRKNIGDYIKSIFALKSYIENDISYNRYLVIVQSIVNTINTVAEEMEEKIQKGDKK